MMHTGTIIVLTGWAVVGLSVPLMIRADRRIIRERENIERLMALMPSARRDIETLLVLDISPVLQREILDYAFNKSETKPSLAHPGAYDAEVINCAIEAAEIFHQCGEPLPSIWKLIFSR